MYIVLFTTSGAASCPAVTPVENVNLTPSWPTLPVVIWVSPLNRVLA
jgi:hypothetical protein